LIDRVADGFSGQRLIFGNESGFDRHGIFSSMTTAREC
jgi:hypothetical protein